MVEAREKHVSLLYIRGINAFVNIQNCISCYVQTVTLSRFGKTMNELSVTRLPCHADVLLELANQPVENLAV